MQAIEARQVAALARVARAVAVINHKDKVIKMKRVNKIAMGVAIVLGLGLTIASVHAQQGPMGGGNGRGMGPDMMQGGMMRNQVMGSNSNMKVMRELMTPAERLSMMDKMMDAKTPEERQAIMTSVHSEMEKRAKEKGIALPAGHGPQMMSGRNCG